MPARVVLAGHRLQPCSGVLLSGGPKRFDTRIPCWQRRCYSLQHPRAAQIQAVQMRESAIARVEHDRRMHPVDGTGQEAAQPVCIFSALNDAAHSVCFGETRREKIFTRWLIAERTSLVGEIKTPDTTFQLPRKIRSIHTASVIEHQSERKSRIAVLAAAHRIRQLA